MTLPVEEMKRIVEGALMSAGDPVSVSTLLRLFDEEGRPDAKELRVVLTGLAQDYEGRGIELKEVASGFRFQVRAELAPWVNRLIAERPPRYSRAYLETLALIAYRQPITRAEIEDVRGVVVSSNIIRTLMDREWVRVVGHKEVPGKPALLATTKKFLDYFNLKSLKELPTLEELRDLDAMAEQLELKLPEKDRNGETHAEIEEYDASETDEVEVGANVTEEESEEPIDVIEIKLETEMAEGETVEADER